MIFTKRSIPSEILHQGERFPKESYCSYWYFPLQFTIEIPWIPGIALNCSEKSFGVIKPWLENLRINSWTPEAWSQNPNFLTVMMSRRGFPVRSFRRGDPVVYGSLGKSENFAKTWRHVFFGWEHVGEFFLPKKKVSESVSYFIYGDNHYQIWIKLVILEHQTFSDPDWEHPAVIHRHRNSATLWQVRGFCVIKRDFQHAFDAKCGFIIFDLSNEAGR